MRRAYLAGGDHVAPCAPKWRLREGASHPFRRGAEGWRRATRSLGAPFTTMIITLNKKHIKVHRMYTKDAKRQKGRSRKNKIPFMKTPTNG